MVEATDTEDAPQDPEGYTHNDIQQQPREYKKSYRGDADEGSTVQVPCQGRGSLLVVAAPLAAAVATPATLDGMRVARLVILGISSHCLRPVRHAKPASSCAGERCAP